MIYGGVPLSDWEGTRPEKISTWNKTVHAAQAIGLSLIDLIDKCQQIILSSSFSQFQWPRLADMWKFVWHKAGYFDERPAEFLNPIQYCFSDRTSAESWCHCPQPEFVRCGWCQRLLCFENFWGGSAELDHFCTDFVLWAVEKWLVQRV